MKNKEWAQKEVDRYLSYEGVVEARNALIFAKGVINQLDDPETLSQEWIDENKVERIDNLRKMTTSDVVPVEKLKNLLVPKRDKPEQTDTNVGLSKVVIPQYVAEQLEYWKRNKMNILWNFLLREIPSSMLWWLEGDEGNYDKLFDAAKYGYEVEKEKRYRVVLPFTVWDEYASELNETTMFLAFDTTSGETRLSTSAGKNGGYRTDLTESQIKAIDKRYWAFAEEVTE